MALKIRQGLEALRTSFVPESGELIYTTDDKLVYVGDGTTPGGNIISSGGGGGVTYGISAELAVSGADLRLTGSDASTDNVNFVGTGIVTVSRTNGNTITIDATAPGGGGSGTVSSGLTGAIAYYDADGDTVVGSQSDFSYDDDNQLIRAANIDTDLIQTSDPLFRIINTSGDGFVTLGGILNGTEYKGGFDVIDVGPWDGNFPVISSFRQVHNDANVNCLTFQRERGTLAAPAGIQQGDAIGAILWTADTDGSGDIARLAIMGVTAADTFTPGSSIVPGTWFVQTTNALGGSFTALYADGNHDTHSVFYHYVRLGLYTPQIDTDDSSALTIVPATVFNSDVEIQNDLTVSNKITANEFISTSTGTPQIVTQQDLSLIAGSTTVTISSTTPTIDVPENINTSGDLNLNANTTTLTISGSTNSMTVPSILDTPGNLTLTANTTTLTISGSTNSMTVPSILDTPGNLTLTANTTDLIINSGSDSMTVPSTLDTATATTDLVLGGTNAQLTINKSGGGFVNLQTANGTYTYEFTTDGGISMPIRTTAPSSPTSGTIYMAGNAGWDPLNRSGTAPYCVLWDGSQWTSISGA